jgi:hypothetical protein
MANICKAMPDLHLTVEDMIAKATKSYAAISGVGLTRQARRSSSMNGSTLPWTSSSVN